MHATAQLTFIRSRALAGKDGILAREVCTFSSTKMLQVHEFGLFYREVLFEGRDVCVSNGSADMPSNDLKVRPAGSRVFVKTSPFKRTSNIAA